MKEVIIKSLGYWLDRALWVTTSLLNTALKEKGIDLSHSQYMVLRSLFEKDGRSQKEIATLLHKDAAAIKRSIDYLEKKDFVCRKHISGCKYAICLTDYGKKMQPEIVDIANKTFGRLTDGMSEETYRAGLSFLENIYLSGTELEKRETPGD